MKLVARWGVAMGVSVAGFALAWWVCQGLIGADESISLGIGGAVLAMLLGVGAWWAPQGADTARADGAKRKQPLLAREKAGNVTNNVSGGIFSGPVLQGWNLTGLTFGASPQPPASLPEDPDAG